MKSNAKEAASIFRFICFSKTSTLRFNCRWVYSSICFLYFVGKVRPSIRRLERAIGMNHATIAKAVRELEAVELLQCTATGFKPRFVAEQLMVKHRWQNRKRWWKGLVSFSIPLPYKGTNRQAVVDAAAGYWITKRGKTKAYVAKCVGLPVRTVRAMTRGIQVAETGRPVYTVLRAPAPSETGTASAAETAAPVDATLGIIKERLTAIRVAQYDDPDRGTKNVAFRNELVAIISRWNPVEALKTLRYWDDELLDQNPYKLREMLRKIAVPEPPPVTEAKPEPVEPVMPTTQERSMTELARRLNQKIMSKARRAEIVEIFQTDPERAFALVA